MAIQSGQLTVTTSAQLVYQADADGAKIAIHNDQTGTADIFLGPAGVTSSTGFHLGAKEELDNLDMGPNDAIYAITDSGTVALSWIAVT